jgi:hypothetical protein
VYLKNCVRSTATGAVLVPILSRKSLLGSRAFSSNSSNFEVRTLWVLGGKGAEGIFLSVIGTKAWRLLLQAIHNHLHHLILLNDFLGLEISTQTAESRWRLRFVYIISLFTFESNIVLSLVTLYLHINTAFPHRNNN